jgi:hypothetical protein
VSPFDQSARSKGDTGNADVYSLRLVSSMMSTKVLTSDFLGAVPFLWFDRDAKGLVYPGDARIDPTSDKSVFQQYDDALVKVFGSAKYAVGDTLDVYRSERMVTFKSRQANLVRRIANARVVEVKGTAIRVTLYKVWGVVQAGDRVMHAERPIAPVTIKDIVDPPSVLSASVFQRAEVTEIPYPYEAVILDCGSTDGVKLGDVFATYPKPSAAKDRSVSTPAQVACAAHVGESFTTVVLLKLNNTDLAPGDLANLVKRVRPNN